MDCITRSSPLASVRSFPELDHQPDRIRTLNVSIITGAGSGIGRACARSLAGRGDYVACADLDLQAAQATVAELAHGSAHQLDVRDADACDALVEKVVRHIGPIGALVASAGIEIAAPAHELSNEAWLRTLDINLNGVFWSARAVGRSMIQTGTGGAMVLIGSINSQIALSSQAAYCASKGGVLMLGKALAIDWAPHAIRVNVIGPGVVDTPMSAKSLGSQERRHSLMQRIPLGRPEIGRAHV